MPNEILNIRSEEVNEILGKPPKAIIRWGISIVFIIVLLILTGSYFIPYPSIMETTAEVSFIEDKTNSILEKDSDSNLIIELAIEKNVKNIQNIKQKQEVSFQLINNRGEDFFYKGLINKIDITSENIILNIEISENHKNINPETSKGLKIPIFIVTDNQSLLNRILSKILKR